MDPKEYENGPQPEFIRESGEEPHGNEPGEPHSGVEREGLRSQRSFDAAFRALGELIDELDFAALGPELGRDLQDFGRRNPVVAAATAFAAGAVVGYAVDRFARGTRRWGIRKGLAPTVRGWVRRAS